MIQRKCYLGVGAFSEDYELQLDVAREIIDFSVVTFGSKQRPICIKWPYCKAYTARNTPFNPPPMPHVAATYKGAAAIVKKSGVQAATDIV